MNIDFLSANIFFFCIAKTYVRVQVYACNGCMDDDWEKCIWQINWQNTLDCHQTCWCCSHMRIFFKRMMETAATRTRSLVCHSEHTSQVCDEVSRHNESVHFTCLRNSIVYLSIEAKGKRKQHRRVNESLHDTVRQVKCVQMYEWVELYRIFKWNIFKCVWIGSPSNSTTQI